MDKPFGKYALVSAALVVAWFVENTLFGSDTPGVKNDVAVAFFFLGVVGVIGTLVFGVLALVRRQRASASRS